MSTTEIPVPPQERLDDGLELVLPGVKRPAGDGWEWIRQGWTIFAAAPLMWVIAIVILFVAAIIVSVVPVVGSLAFQLLQAVFAGGLVLACRSLERGGQFELEHVFAGFTRRFVPLLIVGALLLLGGLLILLVFATFVGFSILGAVLTGSTENVLAAVAASTATLALGGLVAAALMVPLMAAYWFAPALVMLHDMAPVAAMKASFVASFRNLVPFLLYGLVMFVAGVVAMIPFGLGMLVWVPLAITSTYAAYRAIFTRDTGASAVAVA